MINNLSFFTSVIFTPYKRKYDGMEGIVKEVGYYKEYNLPKPQDDLYIIKEITNRSSIDIDN